MFFSAQSADTSTESRLMFQLPQKFGQVESHAERDPGGRITVCTAGSSPARVTARAWPRCQQRSGGGKHAMARRQDGQHRQAATRHRSTARLLVSSVLMV